MRREPTAVRLRRQARRSPSSLKAAKEACYESYPLSVSKGSRSNRPCLIRRPAYRQISYGALVRATPLGGDGYGPLATVPVTVVGYAAAAELPGAGPRAVVP